MKILFAVLSIMLIAFVGLTAFLVASSGRVVEATPPNPGHKVDICHARPPDTAAVGYVLINVDVASTGYQHRGHEARHDADIIPLYTYTDNGASFSFPGKNFDAIGQAIWNNGCVAPAGTPPPTSTSPSTPTFDPTSTPIASSITQSPVLPSAFPDSGGEPAGMPNAGAGAFASGESGDSVLATGLFVALLLAAIAGYAALGGYLLWRLRHRGSK